MPESAQPFRACNRRVIATIAALFCAFVFCYLRASELLLQGLDLRKEGGASTKTTKTTTSKSTSRLATYNNVSVNTCNTSNYTPASVERYIIDNAEKLGYDDAVQSAPACDIWKNETGIDDANVRQVAHDLQQYAMELDEYNERVENFRLEGISDIRKHLDQPGGICHRLELDEEGMTGIFKSGQLSYTTRGMGYIDPLLSQMRHPKFCDSPASTHNELMNLRFLVHDFAEICRNMTSFSRTILIDLGASLLHQSLHERPIETLIDLYQKFGIPFDHIYAFEFAWTNAQIVFDDLRDDWIPFYHWINVGVTADPSDERHNPWVSLLQRFMEDDFVVVKLDIDTSAIEIPLVLQLLENETYAQLVDQFYFEHHVRIKELDSVWGVAESNGTLKSSLDLFFKLREKGVAAHSWI